MMAKPTIETKVEDFMVASRLASGLLYRFRCCADEWAGGGQILEWKKEEKHQKVEGVSYTLRSLESVPLSRPKLHRSSPMVSVNGNPYLALTIQP